VRKKNCVCGMVAALALTGAGGAAYGATQIVDCSSNAGALSAAFASGGTAGTTYVITGPCDAGALQITQDNISLAASSGTQTIDGFLNITAARNVNLGSGLSFGNVDPFTDGIRVDGPARVIISSTIEKYGGVGVIAAAGAVVVLTGATVTGNARGGILAVQGSTVVIVGGTVGSSASVGPLIAAQQSSSVSLSGSATVSGPTDNNTIFASQGSSVWLQNTSVTSNAAFDVNNQFAAIAATDSSSVVLAGGNTITNSVPGGIAVLVTSGSSLKESNAIVFENITAPVDTINGTGVIRSQSVIELAAQAGGAGIVWTGGIRVSQGSSFIADGDNVTINGTLTLHQAANAYFNHTKGTSNDITNVVCNSTTDHVANPAFVTPPVTIGAPPGCALF